MKIQYLFIGLAVLNFIAAIVAAALMPSVVPVHFNIKFEVDGMGSPWFLLFVAGLLLLFAFGFWLELKIRGENYKNKKALTIVMAASMCLLLYLQWLMAFTLGSGLKMGDKLSIPLGLLITMPIGLVLIVMGNYFPVIKQNKTLGLKTFSTLASENVWKKTHRLAGILTVLGGLLVVVSSIVGYFVKIDYLPLIFVGVAVVLGCVVPIVYAFILRKKELKDIQNLDSDEQK